MLLASSDTERTLLHLILFTKSAQKELVSIRTQSIRDRNFPFISSLHCSNCCMIRAGTKCTVYAFRCTVQSGLPIQVYRPVWSTHSGVPSCLVYPFRCTILSGLPMVNLKHFMQQTQHGKITVSLNNFRFSVKVANLSKMQ